MDREEIIALLRDELDIVIREEHAQAGSGHWTCIDLVLCGEVISTETLPSDQN